MTRDHNGWWWLMGGAIVTALVSDLSIINDIAPDAWEKAIHAVIKLLAIVVAAGAGLARMSPLPISNEGRDEAILKNAEHADKASVAASIAAEASDHAAKASNVAVEAAQMAVSESEKASGIQDK